jgi:hypothetical protein
MALYQIVVQGLLDASWSEWFEGMLVAPMPALGVTSLAGPVRDQAELFGRLNQLRDLNLTIVKVERLRPENRDTGQVER